LIEHDFYRLMEIDLYSDIDVVKKRYRELAMLYHPDKNPNNKHAEEFFKILTQGYTVLSEVDNKVIYDRSLKNYYDRPKTASNVPQVNRNEEIRNKIRRHKERKRTDFINEFVKAENDFPHKYRFILALFIFLSGILLCYNNWYINLLNFDIFYVVIGVFLFGLGTYKMSENIYRRRSFKKAMKIEDFSQDYGPAKIFVVLFFVTPIVFLLLMHVTKKVHLTYYYETTLVEKVVYYGETVTFNYSVNGKAYSRNTDASPGQNYEYLGGMRVKFSRINPTISELVFLNNY
jgi:curved DNA-binding protein CbpA